MSEVYLGQIMMAGFGFAPKGFAQCTGLILPVSQNQALFSLLGTTYGGNGQVNFGLPDMRSRVPVGAGNSVDPSWQPPMMNIGQSSGAESVTLLLGELAGHAHPFNATTNATGNVRNPLNHIYGATGTSGEAIYSNAGGTQIPLNPANTTPNGGSQPHTNIQPYGTINFVIALAGIFPTRN
jgi:microcystin-dependent protein